MSRSFGRADRLKTQEDFQEVFRLSRRKRFGRIQKLENYLLYESHSEKPRLGLSIAKKVARKASTRNQVKRYLREFFRQNKNLFRGDTIIRLTKLPKQLDYHSFVEPLQKKLKRES